MKKFLIIALLLCLATAAWPNSRGIIHLHSTFSDGQLGYLLLQLKIKALGYDFMVMTDHNISINKLNKLPKVQGPFGFDRYLNTCTNDNGITSMAGTEIMYGKTHVLVMGTKEKMKELFNRGYLTSIELANSSEDYLLIMAHPFSKFDPFDFGNPLAKRVDGVEIYFHDSSAYKKTLEWYLNQVKKKRYLFVTAGSDFHFVEDVHGANRLQASTWITVPMYSTLKGSYILNYLKRRMTYASFGEIELDLSSYFMPFDGESESESSPTLGAKIRFKGKTIPESDTKVMLYRDGELLKKSVQTIKAKTESYNYSYCDEYGKGRHAYVLVIDEKLVTSPIRINSK